MKGALLVTAILALFTGSGLAQTTGRADFDQRLYERVVWDELQQSMTISGFVCRLHRISAVSNIQYHPFLLLTSFPPRQRLSFDMAHRHYQFLLSSDLGRPNVVVVSLERSDFSGRIPNAHR